MEYMMNNYIDNLKKIENSYSDDIINSLRNDKKSEDMVKIISEIIKDILKDKEYSNDIYENIKHLILISPEEMVMHNEALKKENIKINLKNKDKLEKYKELYEKIFLNKKYRKNNNIYRWPTRIIQELSLNVCPYCNRNYINPRGNSQGGQTDHFFSRNHYPILSISLYNLIPSCSTCNLIKSDEKITCHPFLAKDRYLKFSFLPTKNKQWEIKIKNNKKYEDLIKELKLEEAYAVNQLDINKMYEIELTYSTEYRDKLKKFFQDNPNPNDTRYCISDKYIDRILFGYIIEYEKEVFRNTPLSYLKHDFYKLLKKNR